MYTHMYVYVVRMLSLEFLYGKFFPIVYVSIHVHYCGDFILSPGRSSGESSCFRVLHISSCVNFITFRLLLLFIKIQVFTLNVIQDTFYRKNIVLLMRCTSCMQVVGVIQSISCEERYNNSELRIPSWLKKGENSPVWPEFVNYSVRIHF